MRIKTRSGFYTSVKDGTVVKQEQLITRHETYYVLYLINGQQLSTAEPVDGVKIEVIDKRKERNEPIVAPGPAYNPAKLQPASECPSAGGALTAARAMDEYAGEKVKGEVFFTHKTSPGLVIKSPGGSVLHETKMSDMYKRRD